MFIENMVVLFLENGFDSTKHMEGVKVFTLEKKYSKRICSYWNL